MPLRVAFALAAETVVFGVLIFGAAGTIDWPSGWAFLALFFIPSVWVTMNIARNDPALLDERMKPVSQENQPLWDRIFVVMLLVLFAGWLVLMGLDRRFDGPLMPLWLQIVGAAAMLFAWWFLDRVMRTNTFAAPVVKVQAERGHKVISTGPYAIVRHPMYAGAGILLVGSAFAIGSWWGVIGALVFMIAIAWRTLGEEKVLRTSLDGYDEYAARVRYRILPGVW